LEWKTWSYVSESSSISELFLVSAFEHSLLVRVVCSGSCVWIVKAPESQNRWSTILWFSFWRLAAVSVVVDAGA
jgi:hypothetical protein